MATLKHSFLAVIGKEAADINAHLKEWSDLGWTLLHFSATTTPDTSSGISAATKLYETRRYHFIWTQ